MKHIFPNFTEMQSRIQPLNVNGLKGRMLRIPASKPQAKREILLLYGHHASIERQYGLAEELSQYGNVTMPDFPGFGGMDSFYTIGMKPTLENMADYLATFVKMRYKRKKVTILAMSLGFVIATRMLQKYPELAEKVELLVSLVGFTRFDDMKIKRSYRTSYLLGSHFFKHKIPAAFFYNVILHPSVIRTFYAKTPNAKHKFLHLTKEDFKRGIEFEVYLWRCNDVRTYMETAITMLTLDNCDKQVALPVHHVSVAKDQYFDNAVVEQHMRIIFTDYTEFKAVLPNHAPSVVATKEEAAPFIPKKLRKLLA
jgi:pimeloyl-ACP methyl ester carboxylesterase